MSHEYQCEACGRRRWIEEVLPQEHTCLVCHGLLRLTGRFTAPSLVQRISQRSAKHQTYTVTHVYITHLETRLHHGIVDSGTALDELDKSA